MRYRVLFVDDDANLLAGLRRTLRGLAPQWDMSFVESGQAALELLAAEPFDVIVTDMRMPGMDGATLLNEVRQLYPAMLRIVLSGYSEMESVMRTVGPAHQFLAKPCTS
ncbi:MAG TPA: response regulator, partial [Rhodospirillaceae bacterium]|nr:response regulator [Rhodospirillaceae bacterium]